MKHHHALPRAARHVLLRALLLGALPAAAVAGAPGAAERVDVYPDYYAADGKRFNDLGKLASWVDARRTKAIVFHACMGTANARLGDAIERFRGAYVDVRWIEAGTHGCPTAPAAGRS